ncbi:MAG: hypothetical protein JW914_08695 [Syntrophaceae bacterium]|nr:hypothetical protein [Syntrophaceae bacterium]
MLEKLAKSFISQMAEKELSIGDATKVASLLHSIINEIRFSEQDNRDKMKLISILPKSVV